MHTMQVIMQSKDKKIKTPILNPKKMLRKFVLFFFVTFHFYSIRI